MNATAAMLEFKFPFEPDEDGWPPVAAEWLWFEPVGQFYRLLTFPLWVKGLAYEDLVELQVDDDHAVSSFRVVEPSAHSTMWLLIDDQSVRDQTLARLLKLGCGVTEGPKGFAVLSAVNIQPHVSLAAVDEILDPLVQGGSVDVAYPALKHVNPG